MTTVAIVIPFRDRGRDPLRAQNLATVHSHWSNFGYPVHIVDDGRTGDAQFNRSAAYNRGHQLAGDVDVLVYAEADMLIAHGQVDEAIHAARTTPGLVVPFTQYRYLSEWSSSLVRAGYPPDTQPAESTMENGRSIGALNVISRHTLESIGQWDETFEGSWYDDNAMRIAFEICAGPTRWINGPAHHLYHQPGWTGPHLSGQDRAATAANRRRLAQYRVASTPDRIRALTTGLPDGVRRTASVP